MRTARLVVVYVFVACPSCGERQTQRVGGTAPVKEGPAIWHTTRLLVPVPLICPECECEFVAGGEGAFAMPVDTLAPMKEDAPASAKPRKKKGSA
jgi:hypothetical protein